MNKLLVSAVLMIAPWCAAFAQENKTDAEPAVSFPVQPAGRDLAKAPDAMKDQPAVTEKTPAKGAVRADRLDLETTIVSGNRELPKVLYIVPWKRADLGELPAQPFNTLLDEVLLPVDRDVFKREVKYFQAVANGVGSGAAPKSSVTTPVPPVSP